MSSNPLESSSIKSWQAVLFPYSYAIIGDSQAAEDVVQEVLNNHFMNPDGTIQNLHGYLIRSVINRSINEKKKIQSRRTEYPGPWLPSPIVTDEGVYKDIDRNKILHYSLLVLLEHLNPKERAVFILKETFDFSHEEIAEWLDIEIDHSRQLLRRARQKLEPGLNTIRVPNTRAKEVIAGLEEAILQADLEKVKQLLTADVQTLSDGGPTTSASRNPIVGKENVFKLLKAIYGKYLLPESDMSFAIVNHMPAIVYRNGGQVYRCAVFDIRNTGVENIYIMVNPDKLKSLS